MSDYDETLETDRDDITVTIHVDEYADENSDPRQYDNLGNMVCLHDRYTLGDTGSVADRVTAALERTRSLSIVSRWLRIYEGATVILPLGLIDHSGISMYVGGGAHPCDPGGWDSGTVGIIFDTAASRAMTGVAVEDVSTALADEVTEYDKYLTGEVYGYTIEDEDGETLDSCWGILGYESVKAEAMASYGYETKVRPLQLTLF